MTTWQDLISGDPKHEVERAVKERQGHAAWIVEPSARDLAPVAEEISRVAAIFGPAATTLLSSPYVALAPRALRASIERVSPEACASLISFATAVAGCGGPAAELHAATTMRILALEAAWLSALADGPPSAHSTTLSFAALACGLPDLVARFPQNNLAESLADAMKRDLGTARGRQIFEQTVDVFPLAYQQGILTFSHLMLVGRAYAQHIERRGIDASGAALHEIVNAPAIPYLPGAVDEARVQRGRALFAPTGEPSPDIPWTSLELWSIHGLYGGEAIRVSRLGETVTERVAREGLASRHEARMSARGLGELAALVARVDFTAPVAPARAGVPDEHQVTLAVETPTRRCCISKWANDHHAAFDALASWLVEASAALGAATLPVRHGRWDWSWEPPRKGS